MDENKSCNWLLAHLPVNPQVAQVAIYLFQACLLFALAGCCTRVALWGVVLLGIYVLGIPQFYGKVDYYHHLLWFLALLAVSPCGDFLSVDAIIAAGRRADKGEIEPASPERVSYALPLRFAWILIGMIYSRSLENPDIGMGMVSRLQMAPVPKVDGFR